MNTTTEAPKLSVGSVTFFPVPIVPSFAPESAYLPRRGGPTIPRKYSDFASALFFNGGTLPVMRPEVDRVKATQAVGKWLKSWEPAHEAKEATVAYALWVWCDGDLSEQNTVVSHGHGEDNAPKPPTT